MLDGSRRVYEYRGAEDLIMEQMTTMVRDEDPDIITGYNIDNFDFPRLVERMDHHTSRKQWQARSNLLGWGRT
ncbi:MAG: 3'-5' exonuclease, partial [Candidatus Poseidoniaceae archaeon]